MTSYVSELERGEGFSETTVHPGSLADLAASEPANGVYLVARSWQGGKVLELDAHFDRLTRSARGLGHDIEVPRQQLRAQLEAQRRASGWLDIRFRITAILDTPIWWRVSIEEARPVPDALLQNGVRCLTVHRSARARPEVKSTAWLHARECLQTGDDGGDPVYEHLLTDDIGRILEGSSANFYAVVGGTLMTAGQGVLAGIARRIVLTVARPLMPVQLTPPRLTELGPDDEAFISSATRGVVPVRRIDDHLLGPPGLATRRIMAAYDAWLAAHLEPLVEASDCSPST